ncbi:MAG: type II secretion system minor pseudopilin GspI [Thiothrix sp.]|nr:type II secretion system minor pseudopilin GspI [Thiothrix sp.]HPE61604.1 type II secretion system minor pseudopilin GspI [Thiolinea sp.]
MKAGSRNRRTRGFTLIEVLMALFLIALVIGVASKVAGNSVRNMTLIRETTFARWVALNQLELYRIARQTGEAAGTRGEEEMGNMQWRWVIEPDDTTAEILKGLKVSVYRADDDFNSDPVVTVKGFEAGE